MPKQNIELNDFTGGLFTEHTGLNAPANTAEEIDNFIIEKTGGITKRGGLDQTADIDDSVLGTGSGSQGPVKFTYLEKNDRVVATGRGIGFNANSNGAQVDFTNYFINSGFYESVSPILDGCFFAYGGQVGYFDAKTNNVAFYTVRVRDVWGLDDGLGLTERIPLSDNNYEHYYNLFNQGWATTNPTGQDYGTYFEHLREFGNTNTGGTLIPSNADIYAVGQDDKGDWTAANSAKLNTFSREAAKGKIILDLWRLDFSRKRAVDDMGAPLSTLPVRNQDLQEGRVATFSGRAWVWFRDETTSASDKRTPAISENIFFSRVIRNTEDLSQFYQDNDPTDPDISDLLPTDGGNINIPGLSEVVAMEPLGNGLVVITRTEAYFITGPDGVFRADDFSVESIGKLDVDLTEGNISGRWPIGPAAVANLGTSVVVAGLGGLYHIHPNEQGKMVVTDMTQTSIKEYYDSMLPNKSVHYHIEERVVRIVEQSTALIKPKELIFDLDLGCFYTHSYDENMSFLGYMPVRHDGFYFMVGAESGRNTFYIPNSSTQLYDDVGVPSTAVEYTAKLTTNPMTFGNSAILKSAPYIVTHFNRTETGFTDDGSGNLTPLNASNCTMQARWDQSNSAAGGKWGQIQTVYRYPRMYIPSGSGDPFDTGDSHITTKNKVRGRGRALQLHFESTGQYKCEFLGWNMLIESGGVV